MSSFKIKYSDFWVVFLMFVGLFVHSFAIPIAGFNIRPYLLTIFIFLLFNFRSFNFHISRNNYLLLLLPIVLYWLLQIPYLSLFLTSNIKEHLITTSIIIIFIIISIIVFNDINFLIINSKSIYQSIFIIFFIGLILFGYVIAKEGIGSLWNWTLQSHDKLDYLNTLRNIVIIDRGYLPRNCGYHMSPNFWAGFCILAFYILFFIKNFNSKDLFWFKLATIVVAISFILTFSRGSFIAFLVGVLYYKWDIISLKLKSLKVSTYALYILILLILYSITIWVFDLGIKKSILSFFAKFDLNFLFKDARFRIWKYHFHEFLNHPLFGEGLIRLKKVFVPTLNPPRLAASHNDILNLLNYMGIIGTIIFSLITFYIFHLLKKAYHTTNNNIIFRLGQTMLITLFVYTLFEHAFVTLFFWATIVLCISMLSFNTSKKLT